MERYSVLPFTIGCDDHQVKKRHEDPKTTKLEDDGSPQKKKNFIMTFLSVKSISDGLQRLIISIKSFSKIFVYKEEIEEEERDMEIGFPTDVKHVTHIGLDGSRTTNLVKGRENFNTPQVLSFPSISLKQFELAMAAQSHQ